MGISGPYTNKEKAFNVAASRCLQFLAFYRGLAVQIDLGSTIDSNGSEMISDYSVVGGTSDKLILETAKDMEIVETLWLGGKVGAVVFARVPEMKSIRFPKDASSFRFGYVSAYATSEKTYSSFVDAIEAATFRASQALLSSCISTVIVDSSFVEATSEHYSKTSFSISGLKMKGFTVLSYEYNPEERKVYAFVVCKQ